MFVVSLAGAAYVIPHSAKPLQFGGKPVGSTQPLAHPHWRLAIGNPGDFCNLVIFLCGDFWWWTRAGLSKSTYESSLRCYTDIAAHRLGFRSDRFLSPTDPLRDFYARGARTRCVAFIH